MEIYPIDYVIPHPGCHADEYGGHGLLYMYGEKQFPGIRQAEFFEKELKGSEEEHLRARRLPLGQIPGGKFNDKDSRSQRIPNECTTTRVAKILGVHNDRELQPFLRAVLRVDQTATANPADLSMLIKQAKRNLANPDELHYVHEWAMLGFYAILFYCHKGSPACNQYIRPLRVLDDMVRDGEIPERATEARIRKALNGSEKNRESCLEIAYIARALKFVVSPEKAYEWIQFALRKMVAGANSFRKALWFAQNRSSLYELGMINGNRLQLCYVCHDDPDIAKASRLVGERRVGVTVISRSSGNLQILPNTEFINDFSPVAALVRLMETPTKERASASYEEYLQPGDHPKASCWHVMDKGMTLNGSESHPNVTPSQVPIADIIQAVRWGLSDPEVWFECLAGRAQRIPVRIKQNPEPVTIIVAPASENAMPLAALVEALKPEPEPKKATSASVERVKPATNGKHRSAVETAEAEDVAAYQAKNTPIGINLLGDKLNGLQI